MGLGFRGLTQDSRFHAFTYDATGGDGYNMSNCQLAAERFQKQHSIDAKFWCEKGPYKKLISNG